MHKGGRPCGKSAATLNREREQEQKANPEKRQRRLEDDDCKKINFFAGHTRATVSAGARATASAGADTVCVPVLDSEARLTIKLDRLIVLSKSSLLGWFLHVSLIVIIKGPQWKYH
jgi:hypothetical protein